MRPEELVEKFPEQSFVLRWIKMPGPDGYRFRWRANWGIDYVTSDSGCLCEYGIRDGEYGCGDTPEDAISNLAKEVLSRLERQAEHTVSESQKHKDKLADTERLLGDLRKK